MTDTPLEAPRIDAQAGVGIAGAMTHGDALTRPGACLCCGKDLSEPKVKPIARALPGIGVVQVCGPACAADPRFAGRLRLEHEPGPVIVVDAQPNPQGRYVWVARDCGWSVAGTARDMDEAWRAARAEMAARGRLSGDVKPVRAG